MRHLVHRAVVDIADSPRYRNYPAYSLLIGLIVMAYADWPVDVLWWMAVVQNPVLDTLHLTSILLPLWLGVVLGSIGIFRRPWMAKIAAAAGICLGLDGIARWHFWPWHPLAELKDLIYTITLGTPIQIMMDFFDGDHITTTQALALYMLVIYLCVRPLLKRGWGRLMASMCAIADRWPRLQFMVRPLD